MSSDFWSPYVVVGLMLCGLSWEHRFLRPWVCVNKPGLLSHFNFSWLSSVTHQMRWKSGSAIRLSVHQESDSFFENFQKVKAEIRECKAGESNHRTTAFFCTFSVLTTVLWTLVWLTQLLSPHPQRETPTETCVFTHSTDNSFAY